MRATLLEKPVDRQAADPDAPGSVAVPGPDGAVYRFEVPAAASPTEVAAIAATLSAALSAETDSAGGIATGDRFDGWRWAGRLSATGRRAQLTTTDAWTLSGRPGLR